MVYAQYYAVREADQARFDTDNLPNAINSKLYRANAGGTPVGPTQAGACGVKGDIQPAGVSKATVSIPVFDNDNDADSAVIQIEAKEAGTNGNGIQIRFFASNRWFGQASVAAAPITVELNVDGNGNVTNNAQAIVDAINSEGNARRLVTAGVANNSDFGEQGQNLPGTAT